MTLKLRSRTKLTEPFYITKYATTAGIIECKPGTPGQSTVEFLPAPALTAEVDDESGRLLVSHRQGCRFAHESFAATEWAATLLEARKQAVRRVERALTSAKRKVLTLQVLLTDLRRPAWTPPPRSETESL